VSAIPPIDQSLLPAEIRNGSSADKKSYQAALGFERMLLGELTKAMTDTAKPSEGDQSGDAASTTYMQMLPDQLADAVTANGGIGLARSLYESVKESS
jgi:Rod binding domain-containing protein